VRVDGTAPTVVVLAFENDGTIPEEQLRVLFEPFHPSQQHRPRGLGLGLHLARAVIEGHGGHMQASCADGVTRFTVVLPRALSPAR
jgi:two-component system heavy metal sensor histidine kinase CusS